MQIPSAVLLEKGLIVSNDYCKTRSSAVADSGTVNLRVGFNLLFYGAETEGQNHQFINLLMFITLATGYQGSINRVLTLLPKITFQLNFKNVGYNLPALPCQLICSVLGLVN